MTVLYILISTDPFGGATKSFMALLKGIVQTGIKAVVVVPDTDGIYPTLLDMNVKVIVQYEKGCTWTGAKTLKQTLLYIPRQLGRMLINYRAQRSLEKKLKDTDIDIVHSNNSTASLGRYIAERRDLPHICHIREYGDKDFGLRYFPSNTEFHRYLKRKDVYSICITKDIQRHHGLSGHSTSRVIYNGIIEGGERTASFQQKREHLLYAGRIEPTKGLLKLTTAYNTYLKRMENKSVLPLLVAGEVFDESYMQRIQEYIVSNHLTEHIRFLGKVNDMSSLYRQAKAIIIPSENEGFGRCMPEAMSYGCIAIAHNTGGSKEQLDNGLALTGKEIGFRYDSTEELAERLVVLHDMKTDNIADLQQRAYQSVCQLYSNTIYIDSVIDFYNSIIKK